MGNQTVTFDITKIAEHHTLGEALKPVPQDIVDGLDRALLKSREFYRMARMQTWVETYQLPPLLVDEYQAYAGPKSITTGGDPEKVVVGSEQIYIVSGIGKVYVTCKNIENPDQTTHACTVVVTLPNSTTAQPLYTSLVTLQQRLENSTVH
jgi:hypothetical protein